MTKPMVSKNLYLKSFRFSTIHTHIFSSILYKPRRFKHKASYLRTISQANKRFQLCVQQKVKYQYFII